MKLTPHQQKALAFMQQPRTSAEVADYMGWKQESVYATLRLLQRLDLVERISPYERAKATFVATGRAASLDDPYIRPAHPNAGMTFLGVRL